MNYLFEYVRSQPDITIADAMEAEAFNETLLTVDELRNYYSHLMHSGRACERIQ
jgi:hypothetical protein